MNRYALTTSPASGASVLLCGLAAAVLCAASPAQEPLQDMVREAERLVREHPEDHAEVTEAIPTADELLAGGITQDEAVLLAMARNRQLQAAFDELGISRADLAQAGLWSNPELSVLLRVPAGGGGTSWEVEGSLDLADLWRVPLRRRVAAAQAQATTMRVIDEFSNTLADARQAHAQCLLSDALLGQAETVRQALAEFRDQVYARYEYGYGSELDKADADVALALREIAVEQSRAQQAMARAHLSRVLGLDGHGVPTVVGQLTAPDITLPDVPALVTFAQAHRPDLLAARHGVDAAQAARALERRSTWSSVRIGPAYAHEADGSDLWGAAVSLQLPLLDSNRAMQARTGHEASRSVGDVAALEARIAEEVAVASETLRLALRSEQIMRRQVLPARERALSFATEHYNQMEYSMLVVLAARRERDVAVLEHLRAIGETRRALIELEFAIGGHSLADVR